MDEIRFLHREAQRCRELALETDTEENRRRLDQLARHYEQEARRLNVNTIRNAY